MNSTAIRRFHDDDEGYLKWRGEHPNGFVLNTQKDTDLGFIMHRVAADCSFLRAPRQSSDPNPRTSSHPKLCDDSERSLQESVGDVRIRYCRLCFPSARYNGLL